MHNKHGTQHGKPCVAQCDEFQPSQNQLCFWENFILPKLEEMKPDTTLIDALLEGISIYDCDDETLYDCNDVVLYPKDGKFYKSLKNENDRDPQDSGSWEEYDTLKGMMAKIDRLTSKSILSIDYHASCDGGCVAMASLGQCVAVKYDTGEVDSCDKPIYINHYYISLEDKNIDIPAEDVDSWDGPYTDCDIIKGEGISLDAICGALTLIPEEGCQ